MAASSDTPNQHALVRCQLTHTQPGGDICIECRGTQLGRRNLRQEVTGRMKNELRQVHDSVILLLRDSDGRTRTPLGEVSLNTIRKSSHQSDSHEV